MRPVTGMTKATTPAIIRKPISTRLLASRSSPRDFAAGGPARHQHADQNDDRPPDTHQQPIRAGHVRRGVLGVLGHMTGGVGVVQVDRVLGQHGDDAQHGHGQAAGNVDLGGFSGPRQHEAGRHHGGAISDQAQNRTRLDSEDAQHQSGADEDGDDRQ